MDETPYGKLNYDAIRTIEESKLRGDRLQRKLEKWQKSHFRLLRSHNIPIDGTVELMNDGTLMPSLKPQQFRDTAEPKPEEPDVPTVAPAPPAEAIASLQAQEAARAQEEASHAPAD